MTHYHGAAADLHVLLFVQIKEEKQAKRAKLASKSKLSFADEEEEDEVSPKIILALMLACQAFASKTDAVDQPP